MMDSGALFDHVATEQRPDPRQLMPSAEAVRREAARVTSPAKEVENCIADEGFGIFGGNSM